MRGGGTSLGLAVALLMTAGGGARAVDPPVQARLLSAVKACDPAARSLIERLVAVDSGTGDEEGLAAVGALDAAELEALGAVVRRAPPPAGASPGANVVGTLSGSGRGRILLISHMDTVFHRGDAARMKPHWDGDVYFGPGAGDDKSGAVTAICALQALRSVGFRDFGRIDLLLNASEETGSSGSRDLIRAMARDSDLVINLERGVPADEIVTARKGSAVLTLRFTGRAAHSGLEPEKGRNAALEAAHAALALGALGDPSRKTTVTVVVISAGDKINIVPDQAVVRADVRAFSREEFARVELQAAQIAAHPMIEGVTVRSELQRNFPPWTQAPGEDRPVGLARRLYAELGRTLTTTQVGSSADVNFAAEAGAPALDGFGMEGGGAHTELDHADFQTLAPRAYLLARLLMEVGHDPAAH